LGGDEQIVAADRRSGAFQLRADFAVVAIGWRREGEDIDRRKMASSCRVNRSEPFLAAPKRNSAATMMLVRMLASPCRRMC
jgi:hypothetical protein